jgi:prepilin-type N-terminal cleavage/methylation domain-containing protein
MKPARTRTRGFTLVEVVVSLAMLGTFLGSLILVLGQGSSAARAGMARQSVDGLTRRTLDRLASELVGAVTGSLTPDPGAPYGSAALTFQRVGAYADGALQWGEWSRSRSRWRTASSTTGSTTTATAWSTSASC